MCMNNELRYRHLLAPKFSGGTRSQAYRRGCSRLGVRGKEGEIGQDAHIVEAEKESR